MNRFFYREGALLAQNPGSSGSVHDPKNPRTPGGPGRPDMPVKNPNHPDGSKGQNGHPSHQDKGHGMGKSSPGGAGSGGSSSTKKKMDGHGDARMISAASRGVRGGEMEWLSSRRTGIVSEVMGDVVWHGG